MTEKRAGLSPGDYDWLQPFTPRPTRRRVDVECDYCRSHQHLRWMPWHDTAPGCTSELRQHCTCPACRAPQGAT